MSVRGGACQRYSKRRGGSLFRDFIGEQFLECFLLGKVQLGAIRFVFCLVILVAAAHVLTLDDLCVEFSAKNAEPNVEL